MLDLSARAASSDAAGDSALIELRKVLEELRVQGYGLEGSSGSDTVLASATVLAALAREGNLAEELLFLLTSLEGPGFTERRDPDLALALAQGWLALLTVPLSEEIPVEERTSHLEVALRAAEAIDGADQRDAFGCRLAQELHLLESGRSLEATESLERALERFPDDLDFRPYLLCSVADERRIRGSWSRAWLAVQQAEKALAEVRERFPERDTAVLQRWLAGVRCQLELASGLLDQAVRSLEREREAVDSGARDPESRLDLLLNVSGVALVSVQPPVLGRALDELDGALKETRLFSDRPGYRARVVARRAILQEMWEDVESVPEPRAAGMLEAALAEAGLDDAHRTTLLLRLLIRELGRGELSAAESRLSRLEKEASGERAPELAATVTACRALLALTRGAERGELEGQYRDVQGCFGEFLVSWGAGPEREGGVGYLGARNRRLLLGVLIELCLKLEGESAPERAIDLLLPEQALGSLARKLGAAPGSVAEVRSHLLRPGTGLLLYLPGHDTTHLFCIDTGGIEHFSLPWRYELEPLPRELADRLASSPARLSEAERKSDLAEIEGRARELARRLLPAAVQKRLATWSGGVYVVGAELLGGIPFECLPLGKESLGTRVALAYLPSIPVGLELARRAREEPRAEHSGNDLPLLLVASPAVDPRLLAERPNLAAFPFTSADEVALTSAFEDRLVLSGREANRARLAQELRAKTPRVLHLLVHGLPDLERELTGGLALAPCAEDPDGLLWCEDVFASELVSPPLVLLSACGSARGPRRAGDDGLAQLGGAFLSRGARCTVQAAGDIALAPTIRLMSSFSRELAAGKSPAEALRVARAELARDPGFAHPFYAQSLRVVGLGLEPVFPSGR